MQRASSSEEGTYFSIPAGPCRPRSIGLRVFTIPNPQGVVIALPGYHRSSAELKYRALAQALGMHSFATVVLDLGFLLEDRVYHAEFSFSDRLSDIERAETWLREQFRYPIIGYAGHSLGACLAVEYIRREIGRHVRSAIPPLALIAPALNQKQLLRYYWFCQRNPGATWHNFVQAWEEDSTLERDFGSFADTSAYRREVADRDFSPELARFAPRTDNGRTEYVLHVHGLADPKVPYMSLTVVGRKRALVPRGNHDLEAPDALAQWIPPLAEHFAEFV